MGRVTTTVSLLLASGTTPAGNPDPDRVTPGLAGFLVVFGIALVTVLLIRSMTSHLRKVRYSPDPAAEDAQPAPDVTTRTATPKASVRADGTEARGADADGDRPGPGGSTTS